MLAEGYALPSIAEHAAAMKRLGHLPNVGPTLPGAPLDLSERYGTLLNELEHAHLISPSWKTGSRRCNPITPPCVPWSRRWRRPSENRGRIAHRGYAPRKILH
ncbi:MAG: hypothetical protein R3D85_15025 [Paracoccaceae bacterium]